MKYIDYYNKLMHYMKEFNKKNYFERFNNYNYFYLSEKKTKVMICFSSNFEGKISQIDFFFDKNGINYFLDSMNAKTLFMLDNAYQTKSTIALKNKNFLDLNEINYLKKLNLKLVTKYNLLAHDYREGEFDIHMDIKTLKKVLKYVEFLSDLIINEEEYIIEAFKNQQIVISSFDSRDKSYDVVYSNYARFDQSCKFKDANSDFIEKFKNSYYSDDTCYVSRFYDYEVTSDKRYYRPILFVYYEKTGKTFFKQYDCSYKEAITVFLPYLANVFSENGLPVTVAVNDRELLNELSLTLEALDIEIKYERENYENQKEFLKRLNEEKGCYEDIDEYNDYMKAILRYKSSFFIANDNLYIEKTDNGDMELDSSLVA